MAVSVKTLPEGFVLDEPEAPPEGFVLDQPTFAIDEPKATQEFIEKFILSDKPVTDWLPTEQAELARSILDDFEDPADQQAKISNAILLSELFGVPFETVISTQPEMMDQIYGKELRAISNSVVNKTLKEDAVQALKETPENIWIGTIGMGASALESVKRRAMQLAGGGVLPDEAIRSQFEAVTPSPEPSTAGFQFNPNRLDFIRPQQPLPGAIAAGAFGVVTRLPDIGAKILRSKQRDLQDEQDIAEISNAPITKMARLVFQAGVPSMAVAAGMSVLTGNPMIGLVILGETEGGAAFEQQLQAGGSIRKSLIIAELSEAAEIGGEMLVFPKIVKGLTEGISLRKALTLIAENATQEGVTGFNQRFLEVYGNETTKGTDRVTAAKKAFSEGYRAIPENAFVGGATAGLADIPATGVGVFKGRKQSKEQARRIADNIVAQVDKDIAAAEAPVRAVEPTAAQRKAGEVPVAEPGAELARPEPGVKPEKVAKPLTEKEVTAEKEKAAVKVATIPGTKIQFDQVTAPADTTVVRFFREGEQVHEIQVDSAEEQADLLAANEAILAEKGEVAKPKKRVRKVDVTTEAKIIEGKVADKKIGVIKEEIVELEKLQADNKKLEGTTQFDPEFDKFATAQIKKKTKQITEIETSKRVEPVSKKTLGLTRAEIELLTPSQQKELRLEQARGVKVGFRAGEEAARERAKTEVLKFLHAQKITESRRDAARELVMKFVPQDLRGDFLFRVTKARTEKDVRKIAETISKGIARFEKRDAIEDLREVAKAINPKRMLPEFGKTAKTILDSIQIGKIRLDTMLRNSDLKEMAQQVLDTAREDSVAAIRAQQLLDELHEKTARTFAVNQLSVEAINNITDTLIALRFQNELDTIAARDENATEAIRRREEISKSIVETPEVPESLGGKQLKKFKLFHDNMESVLDAVSGARPGTYDLWNKSKRPITEFIYDVLDNGVDNQIRHSEKSRDIFRGILTDNNVKQEDILNWSMRPEDVSKVKKAFGFGPEPEVHTFELTNAKDKPAEFDFTVNEVMSVFMHSRNNHNLSVLLESGVNRIIRGKEQKIRGFTVEKIDEMVASLTDQQKKIARQTGSKLMDGFNKDAINRTSLELEFFELAKVDMYWPARRSITRILRGRKLAGTVKTVEGMGLLKERVATGNPMKLVGFFETVYATNKNVATYVGLAEPLREVKAVYTKETIEELKDKGRGAEVKLITDLIERFEGQSALIGPLDTILKKMLGGFAKAKLFLNVKIAPRQQISSFLISAYVDTKYISEFEGIGTKEITEEISKLSPQMKARFEQLQFDRDIGDAFIENELMNYLTGKTALIDKTAIGMKFFDKNAIIDVYRAVKAEVADKNPGVNIDSKEGKALLKERFEWVTRHTQPMWHPKDRSLIGSDPDPLIRSLTMFMSQREQLVRMVNNGVSDYINSKKTTDDATRLGRTLGTVALNLAAFTLYNFAWAVLIKRKKRDLWDLGKFFLTDILSLPFFGKYIAKSFEITFNALVGKPVFSRSFDEGPIEGILGRILIEAIPNFALAGKHFVTKERYQSGPNRGKEKWQIELLVAVDAVVDAVASLRGIPYYGAKDIVTSVKAQLPKE